jgi:RNA polymerase sigma factor (sigma-70 family)
MKRSDLDLIELAQAGSRDAMTALCRRYEGMVKAAVAAKVRRCGRHVERDDAQQHGMLGFMRGVMLYRPDKGAALATYARWHDLAELKAHEERERAARHEPIGGLGMPSTGPSSRTKPEWRKAHRAIRRLPLRQQQLLLACVVEGMGQTEVGRCLGITGERVRQIVNGALAEVRAEMAA